MRLKKRWLELYQSAVIKVSPESPFYGEFKWLLKRYLFESQLKNILPATKALLDELPVILDEAEKNTTHGRIDPKRLDEQRMDQAIQEMMYTPVVTDHDERGDLDGLWLKVFGIVSTDQLSQSEIRYIKTKLRGEEDSNFSAIRLTLVSLPITKPIEDEKQDKINEQGLLVARELLFEDSEQFPHLSKETKRSVRGRVKAWLLFQTV
jgi:hypothetical protein